MTLKVDYYTLLSRAVVSFERDAYAARGAVYDQEYKSLLRRLITSNSPRSEIAIEVQAFRAAIRRIDFADEDKRTISSLRDAAELTAPDPVGDSKETTPSGGELPQAPTDQTGVDDLKTGQLAGKLPRPSELRPVAGERLISPTDPLPITSQSEIGAQKATPPELVARRAAKNLPSGDGLDPSISIEELLRRSTPRSIARRVGERLILAVAVLALGGTGVWLTKGFRVATYSAPLRGTLAAPETAPSFDLTNPKSPQPSWLSPEIFYSPVMPGAAAPRPDVPSVMPKSGR
jgi:hypothetical protein